MKTFHSAILFVAALASGCGGGGGDGSGTPVNVTPMLPQTVVFRANEGSVIGLWAAVDDGSDLYRLDPDFELIANTPLVFDFKISPDKAWVAFRTQDVSMGNGIRLWVTSMQGGTPVEIITFANVNTRIKEYSWSPSSDALVYTADQDNLGIDEVFLAKPDGTGISKISQPVTAPDNREARRPQWSPDGRYVVFAIVDTINIVPRTLSVDVHDRQNPAPAARPVTIPASQPSAFALGITWAPDSSHVAYIFNPVDSVTHLWVALPDGSPPTIVNPTPTGGGNGVREFEWSPDSSTLAYISRQRNSSNPEVYVVGADGSNPTIQHTPFSNSAAWGASEVKWSPDGAHLAYLSDHGLAGAYQLYVVANLTDNLDAAVLLFNSSGAVRKWEWLPDSSGIIYGGLVFGSLDRLYKKETLTPHSPAFPPMPEEFLSPAPGGYGDVGDFVIAPDGQGVIYLHLRTFTNTLELFANNTSGGTSTMFQFTSGPNRTVDSYQWSPNNDRVTYATVRRDMGGNVTSVNVWAADPDGSNLYLLSASMNGVLSGGKAFASY